MPAAVFTFLFLLTDASGRFHFVQKAMDFESECVDMFPTDRLSIFDECLAFPRHFFFDGSEQMFEGLLVRNFSR